MSNTGQNELGKQRMIHPSINYKPERFNCEAFAYQRGNLMWNKDEIKGKAKQVEGAIKNKVGEVTNNPDLEAEGEAERVEGKLQETIGHGRRKVSEAVVEAGKALGGKN
jgi:uncharacterized protein YjbJ (UPF0337 family)